MGEHRFFFFSASVSLTYSNQSSPIFLLATLIKSLVYKSLLLTVPECDRDEAIHPSLRDYLLCYSRNFVRDVKSCLYYIDNSYCSLVLNVLLHYPETK